MLLIYYFYKIWYKLGGVYKVRTGLRAQSRTPLPQNTLSYKLIYLKVYVRIDITPHPPRDIQKLKTNLYLFIKSITLIIINISAIFSLMESQWNL